MRVFQTLAFINQLRGTDATGVAQIKLPFSDKHYATVNIQKATQPAQDFMFERKNRLLFTECTHHAVMGHNRSATVGDADADAGAHPFETKRFVGMHNGTLKERRFAESKTYATDSEALYNEMDEKGVEETLSKLSKDSAFTLAFFDKEDDTINFVRNDKRPLAIAVHPIRSVVYYSSSFLDLRYALNRIGVKNYHIYNTQPWHWLQTNPKNPTFMKVVPDKEKGEDFDEYRTNTWYINRIEPKPDESDVPVKTSYYYSSGAPSYTVKRNEDDGKRNFNSYNHCSSCGKFLKYGGMDGKAPKWNSEFGSICYDCRTNFEAMGFDFSTTSTFAPAFNEFVKETKKNGEVNDLAA